MASNIEWAEEILKAVVVFLIDSILIILTSKGFATKIWLIVSNWRDRKVIEKVIIGEIQPNSIFNLIKNYVCFFVETCGYVVVMLIELLVLVNVCWITYIRAQKLSQYMGIYIILGVLLAFITLVSLVKNMRCNTRVKIALYLYVLSILILLQGIMLVANERALFILIDVIDILVIGATILIYSVSKYAKQFNGKYLCCSRLIRIVLLLSFSFGSFLNLQIIEDDIMHVIYVILSGIEYFIFLVKKQKNNIEVVIHLEEGEYKTKKNILQYKADKLMFVDIVGTKHIVDIQNVKYLSYCKAGQKKYNGKKKVKIVFEDEQYEFFQEYKHIDRMWMQFSRNERRGIQSKIISTNRIRHILK